MGNTPSHQEVSDVRGPHGKQEEATPAPERGELAGKLDAVGWGLFFVWVGVALLLDVGIGVGLLGIGVITLGMQAVRKVCHLPLEGFWVVVGLLFVVGGLWELFDVQLPLVPLLLILAGIALLVSAARGKHLLRKSSH